MADYDKRKKKLTPGSIIGIIVALIALEPRLLVAMIPLAVFGGAIWLVIRILKNGGSQKSYTQSRQKTTYTQSRQKTSYLNECSVPLRYHRDKGDHHVRKGRGQDPWDNLDREIDPWDRPDIDIRKYQRNR